MKVQTNLLKNLDVNYFLGPTVLLQKEITRLQEENIEQRQKNTELEQRLSDALADKQKLDSDLKSVAGNIDAGDAQKLKNDLLVSPKRIRRWFRLIV